MQVTGEHHVFGGQLQYVEHEARSTNCTMRFTVFLPPQAKAGNCATLIYLAGLTCSAENFTTKAHAYQLAAELGLILVAPDTSPRGDDVANDEAYDLGQGAGFYINTTEEPWAPHFQMESYIAEELPELLAENFPVHAEKMGIFGHSMGGHGALTLHLKYPETFKSVSAFAPICAPTKCAWGEKAFTNYLGADEDQWTAHDATELMLASEFDSRAPILIDQGAADQFLADQLHPHLFEEACQAKGHELTLRMQAGYDHSYFFIQSFMQDHLRHHAECLA